MNPHALRHRNLNPKLVARLSHRGEAGMTVKSLSGKSVRKPACPRDILPGLGWHGQSRYLSITSGGIREDEAGEITLCLRNSKTPTQASIGGLFNNCFRGLILSQPQSCQR